VAAWAAEVIEVAALPQGVAAAERFGLACGEPLPAFGSARIASPTLALCVRPGRWLLIAPLSGAPASARAARWCAGCGAGVAVTELSSALAAFIAAGPQLRELLARGCRLDLDPEVFPAGSAAASVMVQVPVVLAALPRGMLLLTPASTAQHFAEWLDAAARPFGRAENLTIEALF
jgi:sarcosine oxidase subunit gamma